MGTKDSKEADDQAEGHTEARAVEAEGTLQILKGQHLSGKEGVS